jgi:tetratricopeptide (TPR) repeat protein
MQDYGVADVERLLRIPRATLKALVASGFVTPARGARNALRFSFRDLVVLRTAQALVAADIPRRRILRALRQLRRELPESMPLSGLNIGAIADQVVVREGGSVRDAETGQYLLGLEEAGAGKRKTFGDRPQFTNVETEGLTPKVLFGSSRPKRDPQPSLDDSLEASIDRGLALHQAGKHDEALRVYRDAVEAWGEDPILLFDIAVLLEDMGHAREAVLIYAAALRHDPALADAHYNLALVYEEQGKGREAIRHMAAYRRLTRPRR